MMSNKRRVFWGVGVLLVIGAAAVGLMLWRFFVPDMFAIVDHQIETVWQSGREREEADTFFANGGVFINRPHSEWEEEGIDVDQTVVLPLLSRLQSEVGMTWQVLTEKNDSRRAYALIASQPERLAERREMDRIFREADETFAGRLLVLRGHRWVSFEVIPPGTPLLPSE